MENLERQKTPEQKEKPPFLYHGSAHGDIEELEPKAKTYRDLAEGDLIFATPDLAVATIFLTKARHQGSGLFGEIPYAYIIGSREEFIKNDNGGHIYVLPSETFVCDPKKGLGVYEWASREKVKPVRKIEYPSALDAMLENGVQVYFVDGETYQKIKQSKDHGLSIFRELESENQKRGINVRQFAHGDYNYTD